MVLLTRKAVVQAVIESSYGTAPAPGVNDGVLVANPTYNADINVLERNFTRNTLSPQASIVGRILARMEFEAELRSNGRSNTGLIGDLPMLARLFLACGYKVTAAAEPSKFGPFESGNHPNTVTWGVADAGSTATEVAMYTLEVTTAGASGTAAVTVSSDVGAGNASAVITSGTPFEIGAEGLEITPTFTGNLSLGQTWTVWLLPPGLTLRPVSDDAEISSITLTMYKDRVRHTMPGAYGTFTIDATAGAYATVQFTFTGTFVAAVDGTAPSPTYERTLPAQVELARLKVDEYTAIVEKFTFDQANDIQVRPDVSSPQGYIGTRLVGRNPTGGINPEATLVADYDFWGKLRTAERTAFQMRVGTVPGNIVWFMGPQTQYSGLTYADRNGILTYDAGLKFSGYDGDDETFFHFM